MKMGLGLGLSTYRRFLPFVPPAPADYIINNDTDWTALMANSAATLSGKIAEVRGALGAVVLNAKAMTVPLVIRGGVGGSIRHIDFTGTINRVTFENLPFQMTGWPALEPEIGAFQTGNFDNIFFDRCSFRHGYGAGLSDFDQTATYAEYARVDNVRTATTTSVTTALTWLDTARTQGFIEFFNRGATTVYFATGGAGVVATVGSTAVLAGARVRSATLNPQTQTHIAILAASGTPEVNARTEIGISAYLANCFSSFGGNPMGRFEVRNCTFRDVNNGIKGVGRPTLGIIMDNDFDRIYQDVIAVPPASGGSAYMFRNILSVPFSRSGIAENLTGDARDPHGDLFQSFGDATGTIGPMFTGGNRVRRSARRAGVTHQGIFFSDNDNNPSYSGIYSVSDMLIAGSTNGFNSGEPSFPTDNIFCFGATVMDANDIAGGASAVRLNTASEGRVGIQKTVAQNFVREGAGFVTEDCFQINAAASIPALFPNIASLPAAITRAQIETALTTAAEAAGLGAVATSNAIDWTTTDHANVILWQNVTSGAAWQDLPAEAINTLITLPLRRILNRRASQTVVPGVGVEWRSVATDGTTEVQAWTTSSGSILPDQYIQIRKQSSASGLTSVDFVITINGFAQTTSVKTVAAIPAVFHTQSGTGPYFKDPVNVPANTTRLEFKANINPTALPGASVKLFTQESAGCELELMTTGAFRLNVEDGAGVTVVSVAFGSANYSINQWQELLLDVDQVVGTATLTNNGIVAGTWSWTPTGSAFFQTTREISFLGTTAGGNPAPSGWQVEFAECYFTTSSVRTLRKRVEGSAATVNADPWKLGGNAT